MTQPPPTDEHSERTRLAVHTLLDLLSIEGEEAAELPEGAINSVGQRLLDAIDIEDESGPGTYNVNLSPLVSASSWLSRVLLGRVVDLTHDDRLVLIGTLRAAVDKVMGSTYEADDDH